MQPAFAFIVLKYKVTPIPPPMGNLGRRPSFSLGRCVTVFLAEMYAILVCVYEIQLQNGPEKYVSICSVSQAALKAL